MIKLYITNLPDGTSNEQIRELFSSHMLPITSVSIHANGCTAFVECNDQGVADLAIDKLNGTNPFRNVRPLVVEPAVEIVRRNRTTVFTQTKIVKRENSNLPGTSNMGPHGQKE